LVHDTNNLPIPVLLLKFYVKDRQTLVAKANAKLPHAGKCFGNFALVQMLYMPQGLKATHVCFS